jgi:hypothetical protein
VGRLELLRQAELEEDVDLLHEGVGAAGCFVLRYFREYCGDVYLRDSSYRQLTEGNMAIATPSIPSAPTRSAGTEPNPEDL